jgi:hypothetical protein
MSKLLSAIFFGVALPVSCVLADGKITTDDINAVIAATDKASINQDTEEIGRYLGKEFYKYIDVHAGAVPATVRIDKEQYLEMIENGWKTIDRYSYDRLDTVIHVDSDGMNAESYSTIVETVTMMDGQEMTSKVREYATYSLENDRPVIVRIESHTLVGDTTPN